MNKEKFPLIRFTLAFTLACSVVVAIVVGFTGGPWLDAFLQTLWMTPLMALAAFAVVRVVGD